MSNVGVVGAGLMGWAHTFGLQTMIDAGVIDASVVSVHDVDADNAAGLANLSRATVASFRRVSDCSLRPITSVVPWVRLKIRPWSGPETARR